MRAYRVLKGVPGPVGGSWARWGGTGPGVVGIEDPLPVPPPVFLGRFVTGQPRGSAAALHNAVLCRELGSGGTEEWEGWGGVTGHTEQRPLPVAAPPKS